MEIVQLGNNEFTYSTSEGFLHGQHVKMCGACGYVNWRLISRELLSCAKNKIQPKGD